MKHKTAIKILAALGKGSVLTARDIKAINEAVDTMRAYQEVKNGITDLVHSWDSGDLAGAVQNLAGFLEG